ncbi:histidine phosphatase family protein [Chelativorans sp. YIM 93263]|uniref:histidine phosphatase family protein n=1 Tax=Chelativorans sp. YIM 93263 TaxID=2906648 RepID=UPI0023798693|nr:histidine phosphatase family protein [Chelativorans sp. YIM 93263]
MSTVIHLLRHGSHGDFGSILTGRNPGAPLTPAGQEEARAVGRHLADANLDALYTSPQLRAYQTAQIISAETGTESTIADELDEIDFGRWCGRTFDDLASDPLWREWNEQRDFAATPAGETMRDVAARLVGFIERIRREFHGGSIALVSHADVIKAGICHYLGASFQEVHTIEIRPASLTTIAVGAQGGKLLSSNQVFSSEQVPVKTGVSA